MCLSKRIVKKDQKMAQQQQQSLSINVGAGGHLSDVVQGNYNYVG
jgi:hypothetical protein